MCCERDRLRGKCVLVDDQNCGELGEARDGCPVSEVAEGADNPPSE